MMGDAKRTTLTVYLNESQKTEDTNHYWFTFNGNRYEIPTKSFTFRVEEGKSIDNYIDITQLR